MNSRNSINLILFIIVAILIAILVLDEPDSKKVSFKITTLKQENINQIEITRLTSKSLKFQKKREHWYMVSPYQVRANTYYIESLLQLTKASSKSQFTISKDEYKKFKLEPAQATLKLNNQIFLFGTNQSLNLNRYILSNNKLYLIPDRFFYLLNIITTGYIDHALISKGNKITGIKLANYDIKLIKTNWTISPNKSNTGSDDINQFITEWNNSQAIEISKLDKTTIVKTKDIKSTIEITLNNNSKGNNPTKIKFDIIVDDDYYYFVREDIKLKFKLTHEMAERLLKLPSIQQ